MASRGASHVERVSIFGRPVGEDRLAHALARTLDAYKSACGEGTPAGRASWFDLVTAAAFVIFRDSRLDWGVLRFSSVPIPDHV